jgi:hypothetical protein
MKANIEENVRGGILFIQEIEEEEEEEDVV